MQKTKFNSFDEALINADLHTVYEAMFLEFSGNKRWWKHLWESELVNDKPINEPGGSIQITVHDLVDIHFSARTVSIVEKEQADIEFFAGDLVGYGTWLWKSEGDKTRVSFEWHASPNSLKLRIASYIVNVEKIHSRVIDGGFRALNQYLAGAGHTHDPR